MSILSELNSGFTPTVWNRKTVADGDYLQSNTIGPIFSGEQFLATQLDLVKNSSDYTFSYLQASANNLNSAYTYSTAHTGTLTISGYYNGITSNFSYDGTTNKTAGLTNIFDKISADIFTRITYKVVSDTADIIDDKNSTLIYLIAQSGATPDAYYEYIYNSNTSAAEMIGDTSLSLSGYATKTNLSDAIDSEDVKLKDLLRVETETRTEEDAALESEITAEIANRSSADSLLQTNIDNEATARKAADNTISTNLNTVSSNLGTVSSNLGTLSSNFSNVSGVVTANSANWNNAYSWYNSSASNLGSAYNNVISNSSNWNNAYTYATGHSASLTISYSGQSVNYNGTSNKSITISGVVVSYGGEAESGSVTSAALDTTGTLYHVIFPYQYLALNTATNRFNFSNGWSNYGFYAKSIIATTMSADKITASNSDSPYGSGDSTMWNEAYYRTVKTREITQIVSGTLNWDCDNFTASFPTNNYYASSSAKVIKAQVYSNFVLKNDTSNSYGSTTITIVSKMLGLSGDGTLVPYHGANYIPAGGYATVNTFIAGANPIYYNTSRSAWDVNTTDYTAISITGYYSGPTMTKDSYTIKGLFTFVNDLGG